MASLMRSRIIVELPSTMSQFLWLSRDKPEHFLVSFPLVFNPANITVPSKIKSLILGDFVKATTSDYTLVCRALSVTLPLLSLLVSYCGLSTQTWKPLPHSSSFSLPKYETYCQAGWIVHTLHLYWCVHGQSIPLSLWKYQAKWPHWTFTTDENFFSFLANQRQMQVLTVVIAHHHFCRETSAR